ncbi:DMT family transporter [Pelagibius sp. Alg239-R121]|uniref:DMT family transporter n=1 Tax=Pelagibius sp. Alg239-R121 TaxID=2993448 RepID=UPI0024A78D0E|nr:DMT family transporter [Pelagibius sp. Alg239-R121]
MSIGNVQARPQQVARGVTLIVAAAFTISVQDVVFKLFSAELTLWQIFALRALMTLPLFFALAWVQGAQRSALVDALRKWPLLRALFMTMTFLAFYAAIPFLSLSSLGAANYIAPIFVTLLSAHVIGEAVGLRGWIAVFVGFAGVIILLQPGTDAFSPWVLLPVIGAFFYALSHVTTRTKCQSLPLITLALSVNLVMLAAGLIMSVVLVLWQPGEELVRSYPYIFGTWSPVGTSEWLVLGLLAVLAVAIAMLLAGAYQAAPPSVVATFEYGYLVFVAMWDYFFFATSPSGSTILGMLMIIGAGFMVLRRGQTKHARVVAHSPIGSSTD